MATIIQRLNALLNAKSHFLIDQAEDPEIMLAQLMREVDGGIRSARRAVVHAVAAEQRLKADLDKASARAANFERIAAQALEREDEAAARAALERHVNARQAAESLNETFTQASTHAERLQVQLGALRDRREEYVRRRATLVMRQRVARASRHIARHCEQSFSDEDVCERFDTLEQRVADAEAFSAAEAKVYEREHATDITLENIEIANEVDAALERLRANQARP